MRAVNSSMTLNFEFKLLPTMHVVKTDTKLQRGRQRNINNSNTPALKFRRNARNIKKNSEVSGDKIERV